MKRIIKRLPDIIGILLVFSILALTVLMVSAQTPTVVAKQNDIEVIKITYDIQEPQKPQEPIFECLGEFRITAYCSCGICCEQYADNRPLDENGNEIVYGAACIELEQGVSIAADTSLFPFGTELIIDGHKYIVQDRGGAIKGKRIDIYFSDHQAAYDFGVKYKNVYIERTIKNEQTDKSKSQIYSSYRSCSN